MGKSFDPSAIPAFSVIRLPYEFAGKKPVSKLFVVLGHKIAPNGVGYAICIKTTSNADLYSEERKKKGCVCYEAGEVECFPADMTFVEPDNQFGIAHVDIMAANRNGQFANHLLPGDFEARLCAAIKHSITLSPFQKKCLAEFVNCL